MSTPEHVLSVMPAAFAPTTGPLERWGSDHHEKQFSDVDCASLRVRIGKNVQISHEMHVILSSAVDTFSKYLEDIGVLDRASNILMSKGDVDAHHKGYYEALGDVLKIAGDDVVIVGPMMGAFPILSGISNNVKDAQGVHLSSLAIAGSRGTSTGNALVEEGLTQEQKHARIVVAVDDVTDSYISMLQIAAERLDNNKQGVKNPANNVRSLITNLKDARGEWPNVKPFDHEEVEQYYQEAAEYLCQAGVVVAPLANKNRPMWQALRQKVREIIGNEPDNTWAQAQNILIGKTVDHASLSENDERLKDGSVAIVEFDETQWLDAGMGTDMPYGSLDIGFSVEQLLDFAEENSIVGEEVLRYYFQDVKNPDDVVLRLAAAYPELRQITDSDMVKEIFVHWLIEHVSSDKT